MSDSSTLPAPTPQPKLLPRAGRNQSSMAIVGALLATASYFGNDILLESSKRRLESFETARHVAGTARTLQILSNSLNEIRDRIAEIKRETLAAQLHNSPNALILNPNSAMALSDEPSQQIVSIGKALESSESRQFALHSYVDALPDDDLWSEHVESPRHQLQILEEDLGRLRNRSEDSRQKGAYDTFAHHSQSTATLTPEDQKLQQDLTDLAKRQIDFDQRTRLEINAQIENLEYGMAFWNFGAAILFLIGLYLSTVGKIGGVGTERPEA